MPRLPRPPQKVIDAIVADLFAMPEYTAKSVNQSVRNRLRGTSFRFPVTSELVAAYRKTVPKTKRRDDLDRLLRCKTTRTDSGVAPITLLTKPYACPGKCVYCPTEVRMPKSYVASEPAAARALSLKFDPWLQVTRRVESLERNGHDASKIELIIKGGTWSAYPWAYRRWFIKRCFDAANQLGQKRRKRFSTLAQSQKANEKAKYRVIGLTIETRPDWINPKELVRLRELGCTRVELGVQATDDEILKLTKRGHLIEDTTRATILCKAAGFKTDYHFLPGQPGSSAKKDVAMFKELFDDARFRPDMVKIYPCVVIPSAELATWHKEGRFTPLEGEELVEAMVQMKALVPRYCRISRLIRDFPTHEIAGGNLVSNLRDVIKDRMKTRGLSCVCLRCREAGHRPTLATETKLAFFDDAYGNAGGTEHFLSMEDPKRTTLFSFLRLRLPDRTFTPDEPKATRMHDATRDTFPELRDAAIVRELHTYGQALNVTDGKKTAVQHKGLGRRLMKEAERIAKENGFRYLAVISGIGVRDYYRKLGYRLVGTYMRKKL